MKKIDDNIEKESLFEGIAKERRLILVGLGAIGSRLATEVGLLKLRQVFLIDHDRVEKRNLCCSAFKPDHIGHYKAEVLGNYMKKRYPETEVIPLTKKVNSVGLAYLNDATPAVLVGAVDSRRARLELAEIAILLEMPLVDLAVTAGPDQFSARAQVSWLAVNKIDPLDSWSLKDWDLIEQKQSCNKKTFLNGDSRPAVTPVSGMLAATLGIAEVKKLLAGDESSLGTEIRVNLNQFFSRKSKLPEDGYSPLHGISKIEQIHQRYQVTTLSELLLGINKHFGLGAKLMLNREISTFYCGQCERSDYLPGPVGDDRICAFCGRGLNAVEPVTFLSLENLGALANAPVGCLGVNWDLLRVAMSDGTEDVWIQYETRDDDE